MIVRCRGRTASTGIFIEVNGSVVAAALSVTAGDTVAASLAEDAAGTTVTISRVGSTSQTATGAGGTVTEVELGALAAGCTESNCASVPDTGPTKFTAASIDNQAPGAAGATAVNLEDASGSVDMATAKVHGSTFKVKWVSSCSRTTSC